MKNAYEKVIVALDHSDPTEACELVDKIGEKIEWYKIGPVLFTKAGEKVISHLHNRHKKIFLDLKLHDIPNVVGKTVRQVGDLGVNFLTVHCLGGRRMLEAATTNCRDSHLKILGVTLLTSHESRELVEIGWNGDEDEVVMRLLTLALESRLAGVICSPNEIQNVKSKALPNFMTVTPGIRLADKEVYQDDQQRVATPAQALKWGADYIVVGRPITEARDPKQVVEDLFRS